MRTTALLAVAAVAVVGSVAAFERPNEVQHCWDIGNNRDLCERSYDAVSDCVYCLAGAVPPVCVNSEQAAKLPPGVFECVEPEDEISSILRTFKY